MLMIQDILIKAMISSFRESMYLSYFRFQSNAWQDEGVIFFLSQVHEKTQVLCTVSIKPAGLVFFRCDNPEVNLI